jgi:hypothetical protein
VPKSAVEAYEPLNTLKPLADNLWIVDGPLIPFGPSWLSVQFPTRMTVIRFLDGSLFIHSPTTLTDQLQAEISKTGTPRWLVAPNRLHYWWVGDWKRRYYNATAFLAPKVDKQARDRINFQYETLEKSTGYPWDASVETLPIEGSYLTEYAFFHRASQTLILTDLIQNFEARKLHSLLLRVVTQIGGVQYPNGGMPRDMRLTFSKANLRKAIETMIGWNPVRVIFSHGRFYESHGKDQLQRAFSWLLE